MVEKGKEEKSKPSHFSLPLSISLSLSKNNMIGGVTQMDNLIKYKLHPRDPFPEKSRKVFTSGKAKIHTS